MDFFDAVAARYSSRSYKGTAVDEKNIRYITETIQKAPTAGNLQSYEVFIVKDKAKREALMRAARGQHFVAEAPVIFVFFADARRSSEKYSARGESLYAVQDATIAAAYAQLAASALGLATCWVGSFDEREVERICNSPNNLRAVTILPLGYPADKQEKKPRRMDNVRYEGY